jgi:beta-glucanase (GH16 family)
VTITRRVVRQRFVAAALALIVAIGVFTTVLVYRQDGPPAVTASSSAPGTRPQALLTAAPQVPAPNRDVAWASTGEAAGSWVSLTWGRATRVGMVRLYSAGDERRAPSSALLTFDDGSSVLATANAEGDTVATFPERTTSHLRITIAGAAPGADSVALAALSVDRSESGGFARASDTGSSRIDTSSGAAHGDDVLRDGDPTAGDAGGEWVAASDDKSPWVRVRWMHPAEVSSVQVLGPAATGVAAGSPAAELSGVVHFDDGSEVVVSGIAGGQDQPTTIAFAPRVVTSARLELMPPVPGADVGLRELRFYGPGMTPPRWPTSAAGYAAKPFTASCGSRPTSAVTPSAGDGLVLLCPSPGSAVSGTTTVRIATTPGLLLQVHAPVIDATSTTPLWRDVATATAGADGQVSVELDTTVMPHGPVTISVQVENASSTALPVQLFNTMGQPIASPGFAPDGLTLQWEDEFNRPLSISASGEDALYAAAKPTAGGMESFGEAAFADPAEGAGTVSTIDGYLRLRAEPTQGRTAAATQGQDHLSGMVSSLDAGGSGFSAQYGYFEARMLGAPGPGSWPAFWTLNTQSVTQDNDVVGEADVVELYGQNPMGSCHSLHHYDPSFKGGERATGKCLIDNGFPDWTTTWHTYGMRIVPDGAVFFIDGVQIADLKDLGRYDEPFFFMLNLALGGGWPVDLSATGGTTDLYVDWVRVYT